MSWRLLHPSLFFIATLLFAPLSAQERADSTAVADTLRAANALSQPPIKEHRWYFGIAGWHNVLDTYLSPYEYMGIGHCLVRRTEKPFRGSGRWHSVFQFSTNFAYLKAPNSNRREIDAQLSLAYGALHCWHPSPRWRLAAGGLLGIGGGLTYNTRGGNNPAQGRASAELALQGVCEYSFTLFRKDFKARVQADVPCLGLAFSPHYGQSYYEMFGLHHGDRNVRFTYPVNAPSLGLLCSLDFPVSRAVITVGFRSDVRQSHLGGLKRHAWSNVFVVGFTRRVQRVR